MEHPSGSVRSAGGIVLGDGGTIAMVRNKNSVQWLFPKGRFNEGETDEEAARREIAEETGLTDLELIDDLGEYSRPRIDALGNEREGSIKVIKMFLFAAVPHAPLSPTLEIEEARWVSYRDVANVIGNDKDRAWFSSVFERVREAIQRD
jgi:ADP-ribose pyrophosphatase YjhB (NUDIX family)